MTPPEVPPSITSLIAIAVTSIFGLTAEAGRALFAQLPPVPSPVDANLYPLYGLLITVIVVLALVILAMARWVIKQGIGVVRENSQAMRESADAKLKLTEALDKQSEFFEDIGKRAVTDRLNAPSVYSHHPHQHPHDYERERVPTTRVQLPQPPQHQ